MTRYLALHAIFSLCLAGCGPKTDTQVEEPQQPQEETTAEEAEPAPEESAPVESAPEVPPEEAEQEPGETTEAVPGSASKTEVAPIKTKEFDVQADVNFSPSLPQEKKDAALMQIGIATGGVTDCYIDLLEKDKGLGGEIEVTILITPAGVPKSVKTAKNTTGSDKLKACMFKSLKKRKFPKKLSGSKTVKTTVTLTFLPEK